MEGRDSTYSVTASGATSPKRTCRSMGFKPKYFAALIRLSAVISLPSRAAL
ncbi:hypothetical protein [Mycobacterium sp. 852002-50816_SCH5313054-b]|uniref:hypothetical protein n=1 Tax=Mycobacterium sp. 852002-50816_SCH5313054-b TaxID=1834092 RepID=UPI001E39FD2E|nr:hypothetical protein [Mycobacterium sp. 852002-50816_SCH5313054-b]